MQIASVAVKFPSLKVTNADLLSQIEEFNPQVPAEQVRGYQRKLERLMVRAGCDTRYYRDRERNERAISFVGDALKAACADAQISLADVDLLIYCGVGRGFLEPAMGYFVANSLGMKCECFDVLDACMSWVRALSIAYGLFRSARYRHIALVNCEFNIYEAGYPDLLRVNGLEKWRYTFPAFTIGEAGAATILRASEQEWNFHFRSDPSQAGLCTLPLPSYREFSAAPDQLALNGCLRFMSFGMELSRAAVTAMADFVQATYPDREPFDIWFPHAASLEACRQSAEQLNLGDRLYSGSFCRYGNLVSASIPAAMQMAIEEKRLTRGSKVVLCPASAGMSFALVDFVY